MPTKPTRILKNKMMKMETAPEPLTAGSAIVSAEEDLQKYCYMATNIQQLFIGPGGGTFTLGSGDATLVFPKGAVKKKTSVRYAIILHGPFVFPDGSKPGSVIVYINMDGAILVKPVQLKLSHWCITEKGGKDSLNFVHAPHTLESGKQTYTFEKEEDEEDFTTYTDQGVLTIREPKCLTCVETNIATKARYNAITFTQYIHEEDTLLFRIQFICDSIEWNEKMTSTLEESNWKKSNCSGMVQRFCFAPSKRMAAITATPPEPHGPGWTATIEGAHAIKENDFLLPLGKCTSDMEREVKCGYFPPSVCYKILYTVPEEKRVRPALLKVHLQGADVPLTFSCTVKEEATASSGISSRAEMPSSSPQTDIREAADVITALNHQLDARWKEFGAFLHVCPELMDSIEQDELNVGRRMLSLVGKWLGREYGTGKRWRTWKTVVQAVKNMGKEPLAEQLAQQHRVQL